MITNTSLNRVLRNSIYSNGTAGNPNANYGVQVIGVPTNDFIFDAEYNWWGDFDGSGPYDPAGVDEADESTCYDPSTMKNDNGSGDKVSDNVDYCPWIPLTSDTDDDGINDFTDNCPAQPNGPAKGTCRCANEGEPCESDNDCGDCGSCSMAQEDTDGDETGDVCDPSPYADTCQEYCDLCEYCVELEDAGHNVDYDNCNAYNDETACNNANCYWNDQGLPAPGVCTVDICLADADFSGRITGSDLTAIKMDLGRVSCPCGSDDDNLCQKYFEKYTCCLDLNNTGSNLELDDCLSNTNSTDCANANCFWNTQGLPTPGVCTVDICLADNDFSGRITGGDLGVMKMELGRVDCLIFP